MESDGKSTRGLSHCSRNSENVDPNVSSPGLKVARSPLITKSAKKAQKLASESLNPVASPSPQKKIRQRKFVVAKRNSKREDANSAPVACKCGKGGVQKCLCVAYESLRASHEEFFTSRRGVDDEESVLEEVKMRVEAEIGSKDEEEKNSDGVIGEIVGAHSYGDEAKADNFASINGSINLELNAHKVIGEMGVKRRRDKLSEEATDDVPQLGYGNVMTLVKAFEKLLTIPSSDDAKENYEKEVAATKKGIKWELPDTLASSSPFGPSDFFVTSESLGLNSHRSHSLDSNQGRTCDGGRKSRRNSAGSSGTFARRHQKRRQLKATSHKPFNLRTEQRGKCKEEEFLNKLKQMMEEDKRLRVPIAQGLPWTTDEPECLLKPPVKESTRPIDLVLHSDIRAVDRAEFDHQVAEKLSFIEQFKMERDRLQKLEEEEEIRRLRKELVPKAQPLPYFDRPFIPRRSDKLLTVPREPKFRITQHKKIKSCDEMFGR
nr:protein tpx2 [Ipomoea batatas]